MFLDAANQHEIQGWFRMSSREGVVKHSDDFYNVVTYAEAEKYCREITNGLNLETSSNQNNVNKLLKNLNELIIEKNLSQTTGKSVNGIYTNIGRLKALHHVMQSKQDINAIYKCSLERQIDTYLTQLRDFRNVNSSFLPSPPK